jgi:hypothetical protein
MALALTACAAGGGSRAPVAAAASPDADATPSCRDYAAAWVERFRGHVARLDRGAKEAGEERLQRARERLAAERVDEAACARPYCIVRPLGDGRLDSWCGYRVADPTGAELYRWIPYR